jgi:aminoglycoside phosphotransferase family enzyme
MVPLRRTSEGEFRLAPEGRIVDWLVAMRRLPAARMLDAVVAGKGVTADELRALIRLLADFYGRARRRPMGARGYLELLGARIADNGHELLQPELRLPPCTVRSLVAAQQAFICLHAKSLGARGARLVDGHGDLRAEHVYLGSATEAPAVIDCLEFNATLRRLDPMEDLALLLLECMNLGATVVARELLDGMREAMADAASAALMHFYMSQRAATRAKLAAWHLRDPKLRERFAHWHSRAQHSLDSALLFARMAVRGAARAEPSVLLSDGPALEEGRQRLTGQHPRKRLTE